MSALTTTTRSEPQFDLDAGLPALDFVNTVHDRLDPDPRDDFERYQDLLAFGRQAGLLKSEEAEQLAELAERRPHEATAVLARAKATRETIFRLMAAIANGRTPADDDICCLNDDLVEALAHGWITKDGPRFRWGWRPEPTALDRPLWPVIHSAYEFLLYGEHERLRMCAADDCSWLFIDTSRNKSRKWCSMQSCGNRAKIARYRERHEGHEDG